MRLALFLALVAIVLYVGLVGEVTASQCSWNATNWCNSLSNAKECQQTSYCIEAVWKQLSVPEDTTAACVMCQDIIRQARNRLPPDSAELRLQERFEDSFKLLPARLNHEAFRTHTRNSLPELLEVLTSEMSDAQVCTVMGFCNSASFEELFIKTSWAALDEGLVENTGDLVVERIAEVSRIVAQPDQLSCSTCNLLTLALKEKFLSTKREELIEKLLLTCYSLHSLADTCASIVFNYFDDLYDLAKQYLLSNDICQLVNICALRAHYVKPATVGSFAIRSDKFYCAQCKQMVQHLQDSQFQHATEADFKQKLMGFCQSTLRFKQDCAMAVDQYYHVIYRFFKSELDTVAVCTLINVCLEEPALDLNEIDAGKELENIIEPQMTSVTSVQESDKCHLCQRVMKNLKGLVKHHEDIKLAMEHVCHVLKNKNQEIECLNMLKHHADIITELIRGSAPCIQICRAINICVVFELKDLFLFDEQLDEKFESNLAVSGEQNDQSELMIADAGITAGPKCSLCKSAMAILQKLIHKRADRGSISRAMSKVCSRMGKLKGACARMMQKHGSRIVDLMTKKMGGRAICKMIGMCHGKSNLEADSATEDEKQSVDYASFEIDDDLVPIEAVQPQGSGRCAACKAAMDILKKTVRHQEDKGEIRRAMGQVCRRLGKLHHICDSVIRDHGGQIVDLVVKHMSSETICKAIHVCHLSASDDDSFVTETSLMSDDLELLKPEESPVCIVCELIVSKLKVSVGSKAQRDHVIKELLNSCQHLPHLFREPCHSIVAQSVVDALNLLASVAPQEICRFVHFCLSQAEYDELIGNIELLSSDMEQDTQDLKRGPLCLICEIFIRKLEKILDSKAKREFIRQVFLDAARHQPSFIRKPYLKLINAYGAGILDLISKVKPNELCGLLPLYVGPTVNLRITENS